MTIELFLLLATGAALILVALAVLTIRALNAAVKLALVVAVCVGLAVIGVIALREVTIPTLADLDVNVETPAPPPSQVARPFRLSAATAVTLALGLLLSTLLCGCVGAVVAWQWWEGRQKRERLELLAAIYGSDHRTPPRPRRAVQPQQPPFVILQQPPPPADEWRVQ
ncbi:MAG TPA: hypothetical protein ENN19_01030 [Chloroflexi bacterium]|nr:hypothetical protein [Chloroflexota bacterium]